MDRKVGRKITNAAECRGMGLGEKLGKNLGDLSNRKGRPKPSDLGFGPSRGRDLNP